MKVSLKQERHPYPSKNLCVKRYKYSKAKERQTKKVKNFSKTSVKLEFSISQIAVAVAFVSCFLWSALILSPKHNAMP